MVVTSKSEKDTKKVAAHLAYKVVNSNNSVIIALEGELGAGKTTFIKGFAKALGIKAKIKSPTFVLMKKYKIDSNGYSLTANRYLYHIDCYRVRDHRDLATLDLKSIFFAKGGPPPKDGQATSGGNSPGNVVLIEWPERVSKILPKKLIRVHIDHIDTNKRKISIK